MSTGRELILQSLMKARRPAAPVSQIALPDLADGLAAGFIARASAAVAQTQVIAGIAEAPRIIAEILRSAGAPLEIHVPAVSPLLQLPWSTAPELAVSTEPPNGNQSAVSAADFGIAETGTAVFLSGPNSPSSWHFRPGREFILISKACILPRLEDVIARISAQGIIPATVNLVTGPSRTADIEQTIELGAHGPRDLHLLITG